MNPDRQMLVVNLKGDQKSIFGIATPKQVSISTIGVIIGVILYTVCYKLMKSTGVSLGICLIFGGLLFFLAAAPFMYVAFKPIRDSQGNILYYLYTQLKIDFYAKYEVGTYINLQEPKHPVNTALSYVCHRNIDEM